LLPWIHEVLVGIDFETALDAFSGSGAVSYLLKAMGKNVVSNDFLGFSSKITKGLIENNHQTVDGKSMDILLSKDRNHPKFIEDTFSEIFFSLEDLRFLDRVSWNIRKLKDEYQQALAISALVRSCVKRQPRGVFTVAGDPEKYKDGRRDLTLSIEEHFREQIDVYNNAVFSNERRNRSTKGDVFDLDPTGIDLVYMDPPYVPRADDNCYMKRYHFLEGLSCYWEGLEILETTKVKKVRKPYTPFSYRRTSIQAFEGLFTLFGTSIIVLSYSSNGYPDLDVLLQLMKDSKQQVTVFEKDHRYHFGTHRSVKRSQVQEYLIIGR
jgi:DNA adenine methylase/adenine-specific DNA-methyltransferase